MPGYSSPRPDAPGFRAPGERLAAPRASLTRGPELALGMGRRRWGVAQGLLGLALLLLEPPLADGARRKKGRPPAPMGDNEAGAASDRLERR